MQKGASESVSLSRTTCSSTTATPSPLKSLDWWDWEETKKQIQSKAANKAQTRSSSRRQQARSLQPVVLEGIASEGSYASSPLPVIFQRIPSDDVHPSKCFETPQLSQRSRPNLASSSKRDGMMSLRKLLSFSSKVTTPSVASAQTTPVLPSVHRLTWEDDDETPLSVGRKWNLATLPRATTPTPASSRRLSRMDENEANSKKWNKTKLPTSTLSSTESDDVDDGQMSGSSSSKSRAQLRRNRSRPSTMDRWFVRPEILIESKLEEEAARKEAKAAAKEAAKEAAKLARRRSKGNSLMHAVFSGSKNDSEVSPSTK